jgi:Rod binding domain-containing protein
MDAVRFGQDLSSLLPHPQKKDEGAGRSGEITPGADKDAKLKKACQDFEAIFIAHLFKTMRTANEEESSMWGESMGGDLFRDLFETEVAREVSHDGGIGLAGLLYQSFARYGHINEIDEFQPPAQGISEALGPAFERIQNFHQPIMEASRTYDVDPALIYAVIYRESSGNPQTVSSKGAKGLMQLMDGTARELGVSNSFDPEENVRGGTQYLRQMLDRFDGDLRLALAAYNAGPGAVERHGGIPPYTETIEYVRRVMQTFSEYKAAFPDMNARLV